MKKLIMFSAMVLVGGMAATTASAQEGHNNPCAMQHEKGHNPCDMKMKQHKKAHNPCDMKHHMNPCDMKQHMKKMNPCDMKGDH